MSSAPISPVGARTFRLPASAYLVVLFLIFCTVPLALAGSVVHGANPQEHPSAWASDIVLGPRMLLLAIPIVAAFAIARTRTRVDAQGITVRALLGARLMPWSELRGLTVNGRSVYAVCSDGVVRLPCVRIADLTAISRLSEGRLPTLAPPKLKFAPGRRRRG